MKISSLGIILCSIASLAAGPARAFDIQGEKANLEDGVIPFSDPADQLANPDYAISDYSKGSSLALPYVGKSDSGFVSDYGNAITIPGPGIDRPVPIWAYR